MRYEKDEDASQRFESMLRSQNVDTEEVRQAGRINCKGVVQNFDVCMI